MNSFTRRHPLICRFLGPSHCWKFAGSFSLHLGAVACRWVFPVAGSYPRPLSPLTSLPLSCMLTSAFLHVIGLRFSQFHGLTECSAKCTSASGEGLALRETLRMNPECMARGLGPYRSPERKGDAMRKRL